MPEYMTQTEASNFFQDVKDLFVQTDRKFQDTDRKFQDTDRKFQDTDRKFQDTDQKFQDTDRKFQESSREFDLRFRDTEKLIKELRAAIGQLGGRLGEFVEEMVKPAAVRLFHEWGLDVRQVFRNVTRYDDQGHFLMEVDLLVVDSDTAVAIECKSNCSVDDVAEHLDRLARFKENFPQYSPFHLYGAVAAMVMPDEVARFAYRKGLFVLAQSGETIVLRNDEKFRPREW
jgi:hypothetical protein